MVEKNKYKFNFPKFLNKFKYILYIYIKIKNYFLNIKFIYIYFLYNYFIFF
jgi:hypothetical protein